MECLFLASFFHYSLVPIIAPLTLLGLSFVLTLPLVLDWLFQCKAIRHSSNFIRVITGFLTSLSAVIVIVSNQTYLLSIPMGISWFFGVSQIGKRWRRNRSPEWGCYACRGELRHAISLQLSIEGEISIIKSRN